MSCNHPYLGFKTGCLTDNGKDDYILVMDDVDKLYFPCEIAKKKIDFSRADYCFIGGKCFLTNPIKIPCGVCIGCRIDRAREWKIRNCLELIDHPEAYFVTLTYNDACLPLDDDGASILVKSDAQKFLKRLRRRIGQFRYFGCGEYGDATARCHFHFLIYGHLTDFELIGVNKFQCKAIKEAWPFGHHIVESVTPGSIAYVSGYVEKKFKAYYENFPVKPFLMMSRMPGIGMGYLERNFKNFEKDMHVYGVFSEGSKVLSSVVPKAFRRKLMDEPWYEAWKEAAIKSGESMEETLKVLYRLSTHQELSFAIDAQMESKIIKTRKEYI